MKSPYITALNLPAAALPELLRKNDTVIGIIGKTQGVRIIAKPQSMAWSMRDQSKGTFSFTGCSTEAGATADSEAFISCSKSMYSGGKQLLPAQQMVMQVPLTRAFVAPGSRRISWVSTMASFTTI